MVGQLPSPEDPHARHASTPAELARLISAKKRDLPLLTWRNGDARLQILHLSDDQRYTIGRRPGMSVAIGWDTKVSALHAELECVGGEWVISDDGLSTNGTRINGHLVHERARLGDQDRIRIGGCLLAFHDTASRRALTRTDVDDPSAALPELTGPERNLLRELCRDYVVHRRPLAVGNEDIANALGYSQDMVKGRLGALYRKWGIDHLPRSKKRAELMMIAVREGIISVRDYGPDERGEQR
jgi:FHA domain